METTSRKATRGPQTKGGGIKGMLAQYAPTVPLSTAYRFEDLEECVRQELGVGRKVDLHDVILGRDRGPKELKLLEKVRAFTAGKSNRQILLGVGKYDGKRGGARDVSKLTAEERHAQAVEAARDTAIAAFSALHEVSDRWMLLKDEEIALAVENAEKFAKEAKTWLKTPPPNRAAFKIEKYLGKDEAP